MLSLTHLVIKEQAPQTTHFENSRSVQKNDTKGY